MAQATPTLLAAALLAACPAAVCAADIPDLGDWTVAPADDAAGCFASRSYDRPGGTTLLFGMDADGTNRLTLLNANWSIAPQERLKLDFALSGGAYARHAAVGLAADGKKGFVTSFERDFPDHLARSRFLNVARGKVPVERLPLDGSGAAVAELRRCVATQGEARKRPDGIPLDPFAKRDPARRD